METVTGSMATQPTTTKEWEWTACEANSGMEEPLWGDAVVFLIDEEVQNLYNDMRAALNEVFDEVYPDPTPENEEEYFDQHAEWVDCFDGEFFIDDYGSPGVVRLVRDGDRYTLSAWDTENGGRRAIHLHAEMPLKQIHEQIKQFLWAQDPCSDVEEHCRKGL